MSDHLGGAIPQGDTNTWMPDVMGWCVVEFGVRIVIDIGCGYGHHSKWFADIGMNVVGVDGFKDCIDNNVCKNGRMICHDFAKGPYVHGTPFDLAWSAEFLEHVEEKHLNNLRPCFEAARYAVITHGEPHQAGQHHVNCKSDSYWEQVFASWNFKHLPEVTDLLRRTDRYGAVWGRRSLMAFQRL